MSEYSTTSENVFDFKSTVKQWIDLQNETSVLEQKVRENKKRMKRMDFFISRYMRDHQAEFCTVDDQTVRVKSRKTTSGLNKKLVTDFLNKILNNEEKAAEYTKQLYAMRTTKEIDIVKIVTEE